MVGVLESASILDAEPLVRASLTAQDPCPEGPMATWAAVLILE
jgi:hypothetical protein